MKKSLVYIVSILAILLLWQYFGSSNNRVRLLISSPSLCYSYFQENFSLLLKSTFVTLLESFLGLLIAVFFAFTLMIVCFKYRRFFNYILPVILTTQVIPLITLAPFFILWLGIGIESKIALAAVISFYPIFMNFATGFNSISPNIFDLLAIYKSKLSFRITNVYFPLSLPNIFTGLKISATLSVIGSIVAEFSGAEIGLGKNLLLSSMRIEPELMMTSIFLSAFVGGIMFGIIFILERFIGKWYLNDKQLN